MNNPYPLMWIFGAVALAVMLMLWVFAAPPDNLAANRPPGSAIPPVTSSEPAQPAPPVDSGGATSDSVRGGSGSATTTTDRTE